MASRTTLRDVALEAGVSVSTASLALSGSVRISRSTVLRVREAAASLDYIRDQTQSSAAAGRFRHRGKPAQIAAWCDTHNDIDRLRVHALRMGMSVLPFHSDGADLAESLRGSDAAAVVIQKRLVTTRGLGSLKIPVVMWYDEGEGNPEVDIIEDCEWWTTTIQMLERVLGAGYRRPLAILVPARPRHWHDDVRSAALRSRKIPVVEWDGSWDQIDAAIRRYRPDSIIGGTIHPLRAMDLHDRRLPYASLITINIPSHRHCTGWGADIDRKARLTLEIIEQRLRYGERPACRIIIPPHWHAGSSLPPGGAITRPCSSAR